MERERINKTKLVLSNSTSKNVFNIIASFSTQHSMKQMELLHDSKVILCFNRSKDSIETFTIELKDSNNKNTFSKTYAITKLSWSAIFKIHKKKRIVRMAIDEKLS